MRPDRARLADQGEENRELDRRQVDRAPALAHGPRLRLDIDVCPARDGRFRRFAAPQEGARAGEKLRDAEGLRHEVVGARVQQPHLLALLVLDRQDQDRCRGLPPADLLHELEAAEPGHRQVRDDEVELALLESLERLLAVDRGHHLVALPLEGVPNDFADSRLVVRQEHAAHAVLRGSAISNSVPPPSASARRRRPPFNATRLRAMNSPRPLPGMSRASSRRTKRSKTRSRSAGGMPRPWSATRRIDTCGSATDRHVNRRPLTRNIARRFRDRGREPR